MYLQREEKQTYYAKLLRNNLIVMQLNLKTRQKCYTKLLSNNLTGDLATNSMAEKLEKNCLEKRIC